MRAMTISSLKGNSRRHAPDFRSRECPKWESAHASLMLALAHAARGRPKGARLKRGNDLFRVAGSFDKNHGYSTRP